MFTVPGQQHLNTWLFLVLFILCLDGVIWTRTKYSLYCHLIGSLLWQRYWFIPHRNLCDTNSSFVVFIFPTTNSVILELLVHSPKDKQFMCDKIPAHWAGQWVTAAAVDLWPTWAFHVHISETEIDWSKFVNWFLFQLGNYSWLFVSEPWALLTLFSCH